MTYWHMQLHPNAPNFNREREILEQKRVIGLDEPEGKKQIALKIGTVAKTSKLKSIS